MEVMDTEVMGMEVMDMELMGTEVMGMELMGTEVMGRQGVRTEGVGTERAWVQRSCGDSARMGAWAQGVRSFRLALARDVIKLALNRQQRGVANVGRHHPLQLAFWVFHVPGAEHELELLKHRLDGFQIVGRVHVEHRVVLVVELAVALDA